MIKISDLTICNVGKGKFIKILPEFYDLKKIIENHLWHDNESTFKHTFKVYRAVSRLINSEARLKKYFNQIIGVYTRRQLFLVAVLFHDIGKKKTLIKKGNLTLFKGHESVGAKIAEKILKRFAVTGPEIKYISRIIKNHSLFHDTLNQSNQHLPQDLMRLKKQNKSIYLELIILSWMDTSTSILKKVNLKDYNFRIYWYKKLLKDAKILYN